MRCWDCKLIIVLPEVVGGQQGIAGQIRAGVEVPGPKPQVVSQEISCGRCGAHYMITTARKPGFVKVERRMTEAEKEKARLWRGED